jgi:hypothetical protein
MTLEVLARRYPGMTLAQNVESIEWMRGVDNRDVASLGVALG